MYLAFTCVTCVLVFCVLLLLSLHNAKKKIEGFPFHNFVLQLVYDQVTGKIPKGVSFTNHLFQCLIDLLKKFSEEGLVMMYISRPILIVFSEEAMKFFVNEKAAVDKPPEYDVVRDVLGAGLINSNGERWRTHRKIISPVFHLGRLKEKVPLFNEHAVALVEDMKKMVGKESVDILDTLKCHFFNSLSESILGLKQDEENKATNLKVFSMVDNLFEMTTHRIIYPWLRPKLFLNFSSSGRKFLKQNREYQSIVIKVVSDMQKQIASSIAVDNDRFSSHLQNSFTYILLSQHSKDPSFTFEDLLEEVKTMFSAGYDTVTYTTMWCLFLLALHPEIQEKAFNEVQSTTDSYITYEDCCNFTYLEAVILETLRLYPAVPIYARNLTKNVQYGKYKIHKGTTIGFVPYMSQRNPNIYPDPEKFEPDRFLETKSRRRGWTYVPFAEGNRMCIGKKYAFIEMKIFLAYVLRNFKITTLDRREDIGLCCTIVLVPARHIRMKITPRQN